MSHNFLTQDLTNPKLKMIGIDGHSEETGKRMWLTGSAFDKTVPSSVLRVNPDYGEQFPDFFDALIPVMSNRLLAALRGAGVANIDSYPVILERIDNGQRRLDYQAVNVIGAIDGIDMRKSQLYGSKYSPRFKSIVLDEMTIPGLKLFRLTRGPGFVVISQDVADQLAGMSFLGLKILPLAEFSE